MHVCVCMCMCACACIYDCLCCVCVCVCMQESSCLYDLAYKLMDTMHRSEWVGGCTPEQHLPTVCTCSVRVVAVSVVAGSDADVVQQSCAPDVLVFGAGSQ